MRRLPPSSRARWQRVPTARNLKPPIAISHGFAVVCVNNVIFAPHALLFVTFEAFVQSLRTGYSVLETLGLTRADFAHASSEQRRANPADEAAGVTEVAMKFDAVFFGLFDTFLIKQYGDGARRYLFCATTRDSTAILQIAHHLTAAFGVCRGDEALAQPFTPAFVARLVQGPSAANPRPCGQMWLAAQYTVLLHYGHSRPWELLLSIAEREPVDRAVRTKGTVASRLPFRLAEVLAQVPLGQVAGSEENGAYYVDYLFALNPVALGAFDLAQVRIFGGDRVLYSQVPTHLTLRATGEVGPACMQTVAAELIDLYGADSSGGGALTTDEVADLHGDYWAGRLWDFDRQHRLWHLGDPMEERIYTVALAFDGLSDGFALTVLHYERLAIV